MSDDGVSRRGLLSGVLARARAEVPVVPPSRARSTRVAATPVASAPIAWGPADPDGLFDAALERLVGALGPLPAEAPVLVAGIGDPAPAARLCALGADVVEVHEGAEVAGATRVLLDDLPFDTGTFGAVLSPFGAMFARGAQRAHAELVRVAAPGAPVVLAAWTAGGAVGRVLRAVALHDPAGDHRPAPLTWGREERLRQDMEALGAPFAADLVDVPLTFSGPGDVAPRLLAALGAPAPDALPVPLRTAVDEVVAQLLARAASHDPVRLRARALLVRTVGVTPGSPPS